MRLRGTCEISWDLDYDVIVAGYGLSGGMAAVAAHDSGARVALFEKAPHFGGNSILAGGSFVVGENAEETLQYLERTSGGNTDHEVLKVFARGMVELPGKLQQLASEVGFETVVARRGGTYSQFPGSDQLSLVRVTRNSSYLGFPWVQGTKAGGTMFWVLKEQVNRRGIDQYYNAPIMRLVTDASGAIIGVAVDLEGDRKLVRARRGVVLATGGFEHNLQLQDHYMQIKGALAMSPTSLTGDGILMAQEVGAALWHMWHVHGGYGFKIPGLPVALRHNFDGFRDDNKPMPWIAVDRFGRRFMNEYPPAPQDTPIRALEYYCADIQDYPRIPCYLVFDDEGRQLGPIASPRINDSDIHLEWSDDNLAEVEKGYIMRGQTIPELAQQLSMEVGALTESVDRWNEVCRLQSDRDHRRPPGTMCPIVTPPFYAIASWPIISNTQGGPVHNADQQVVNPFGEPIPRLYKCGELGSIFGHLYPLGGSLSECFIGGELAGKNAAAEAPWTNEVK